MDRDFEIKSKRQGWLRGLKFKSVDQNGRKIAAFLEDMIWNTGLYNIDRRLRAFLWASIVEHPDYDWTMTSGARYPVNNKSGHHRPLLSALDIRSKSWTLEQMVDYKNWAEYWWGPWIDVVVEDGRYDSKYIVNDGLGHPLPEDQQPWHLHIEIDKQFWKG